jgi:hypothetical protein
MERTSISSISSEWPVSIFTCEVTGGRCDYCNQMLSADAMSQNLYHAHRGHIPALSAWARILSPGEYREVESYIRAPEGRSNQPRFLALVRGQSGRAFQCEFPVIHVHAPSRSFPLVSKLDEQFLHPGPEEA